LPLPKKEFFYIIIKVPANHADVVEEKPSIQQFFYKHFIHSLPQKEVLMAHIISIAKSTGVLLIVFSAFFSTYTSASPASDDSSPEPGCDTLVTINDFL